MDFSKLDLGLTPDQLLVREIDAAKRGDFSGLAGAIRDGKPLGPDARELISAKLQGTFKAKRGPRESKRTNIKARQIWYAFQWLTLVDGEKPYIAQDILAAKANVSKKTVIDWLKRVDALEGAGKVTVAIHRGFLTHPDLIAEMGLERPKLAERS